MVSLDYVLVLAGLFVLGTYHVWLFITVLHNPIRTVIGLNAYTRQQWVFSLMTDPLKNGVLIVQTLRNNIMASTLLSTAAITLCSVISVLVSSESSSDSTVSVHLVYSDYAPSLPSIKYLCILLCFLVAFLCNVQSTRYYAHVSFLGTVPTWKDKTGFIEYVAATLNRGYYFWALGLRAFYLSIPLFLWIFGPIPMFVSCCVLSIVLYFLDTTSSCAQLIHTQLVKEEARTDDVESTTRSLIFVAATFEILLVGTILVVRTSPNFVILYSPGPASYNSVNYASYGAGYMVCNMFLLLVAMVAAAGHEDFGEKCFAIIYA